jgi:hypothetical protein
MFAFTNGFTNAKRKVKEISASFGDTNNKSYAQKRDWSMVYLDDLQRSPISHQFVA